MRKLESILVVDDDPACLFIAKSIVKRYALANLTFTVTNGLEALKLMQSVSSPTSGVVCPELILVDINMPVMDGFKFLEGLKEINLPIKPMVAMLTTSVHERDVSRAQALEVDAFLNKPLSGEALQSLLENTKSS